MWHLILNLSSPGKVCLPNSGMGLLNSGMGCDFCTTTSRQILRCMYSVILLAHWLGSVQLSKVISTGMATAEQQQPYFISRNDPPLLQQQQQRLSVRFNMYNTAVVTLLN